MGFIVFILKLMFGLDDLTEYQCSNLAESKKDSEKLFVWTKWVELVELRNAILADNFFWAKQLFDVNAIQTRNNAFKPHHNATSSINEIKDPCSGVMLRKNPIFRSVHLLLYIDLSNCSNPNNFIQIVLINVSYLVKNKIFYFPATTKVYLNSLASRLLNKPTGQEPEPKPDLTKSLQFLTDALPIALTEGNYKHLAADVTERVERCRSATCNFLLEKKKAFFKTSADEVPETDTVERAKVIFNVEGLSVNQEIIKGVTIRVKVLTQKPPKERDPQELTDQRLQLPARQAFHSYWVLPLLHRIKEFKGDKTISKNLPLSLLWLLRNCATAAETTPYSLYRELLVIETKFLLDGNKEGCSKQSLAVMKALKALY